MSQDIENNMVRPYADDEVEFASSVEADLREQLDALQEANAALEEERDRWQSWYEDLSAAVGVAVRTMRAHSMGRRQA